MFGSNVIEHKKNPTHVHCVCVYMYMVYVPMYSTSFLNFSPHFVARQALPHPCSWNHLPSPVPLVAPGLLPALLPTQGSLPARSHSASSGFFSIPHSQEGKGKLEKVSLSEAIFLHPEQPHGEILCPAFATWLLPPPGPACSQLGCWVVTALLLDSNTHYASQLCTLSFLQPGLCGNRRGWDVDVS